MSTTKKRELTITPVENGFIITARYHYKQNEKDPGHARSTQYVAESEVGLLRMIRKRLREPAVVTGTE